MGGQICGSVNNKSINITRKSSKMSSSSSLSTTIGNKTTIAAEAKQVNLQIELSSSANCEQRKKSVRWLTEQLKQKGIEISVNYKTTNNKGKDYFGIAIILKSGAKKVLLSNSETHAEAVTGNFVNKGNFPIIHKKIVDLLLR